MRSNKGHGLNNDELCLWCHQKKRGNIFCRAPKFLVDPLEGPSMRQCGRSWNLEHDSTSSTRGGERGVLEVPGKTRKN